MSDHDTHPTPGRGALVAGATGLVGGHLLRQLLASDEYARVIALTRRPLPIQHEKLEQRVVDFDHLTEDDVSGADDVFCALGTTIKTAGSQAAFRTVDYTYPLAIADLAARRGARHVLLVSSVGANASARIFYSRTKGEVEQAVAGLPLPRVTIVRPSSLLGQRAEVRPGERVAQALSHLLTPLAVVAPPLRRYLGIHAETVAAAMLHLATVSGSGVRVVESEELARLGRAVG